MAQMAVMRLLGVFVVVVALGFLVQVDKCAGERTNLEFYMHDNFNLTPRTVINVAGPKNSSFGAVQVLDDPLTQGPLLSSAPVGRAQGTYMFSQLDGNSLLITFTAVFTNGDTLSFHGADPFLVATREIAVIGGTGKYRMARGYAVMTTASNTQSSTILGLNVTVEV